MNATSSAPPQLSLPLPHRRGRRAGFAAALAIVVQLGRDAPITARCPRCGKVGRVDRDFGTRRLGGKRRTQSWCRDCRAGRAAVTRPPEEGEESGWLFTH